MISEVCVDANIIVKWYVPEEHREQAVALARDCHRLGIEIIAPAFALAEATTAVRKKVYRKIMSASEGLVTANLVWRAQVTPYEIQDIYMDAWRIAERYNRPTLYDAYYMALAEARNCPLWSSDERFLNSVGNLPHVKHIRDYVPGQLG